jgi:undecaprenyl pyrophosphate synthase
VCNTSHSKETIRIRFSAERTARNRQENRMTRKLLEQQRECVEAQLRWAVLHGGDQELVDLLRVESGRIFAMRKNYPAQETAAA